MKKILLIVLTLCVFLAPLQADAGARSVITQKDALRIILESAGYEIDPGLDLLENFEPQKPIKTSDFLRALFKIHNIEVKSANFFGGVKNPYLAYGALLNLFETRLGRVSERLTYEKAENAISKFLEIKDSIVHDNMYGKLDMHEHFVFGGDIQMLFKEMAIFGISKVFLMGTGKSPDNGGYKKNQAELLRLQKRYPDKIMVFCTVDEADKGAARDLEKCLKKGGKGLKLLGGHPKLYDEPLNSKNMMKVYAVADKYHVPVLIHGSIINIPQLWDELNDVYSSFPDLTFVQAHYCSVIMKEMALEKCAELLDKYPNLYVDMSMGGGLKREFGFYKQDPEKIRDFILKYQDRLMWGSDIILSRSMKSGWMHSRMECDLDLHKTESFICEHANDPLEEQVGFNLPRDILKKIYLDNPRKILGM